MGIDAKKCLDVVLEHENLYRNSAQYAHNFLLELRTIRSTHGCVWDLPREVVFPDDYEHAADDMRFMTANVALDEVVVAEALQASLEAEGLFEDSSDSDSDEDEEKTIRQGDAVPKAVSASSFATGEGSRAMCSLEMSGFTAEANEDADANFLAI